jgi:histidinol-phosphate aminotransferase/imidazoleglycerol-phosphate dehydratase/histidinol-phosphatase
MTNSSLSDMSSVCRRARPEILAMPGYSSARSLQKPGSQTVFLDANECSYDPFIGGTGLSRYPAQQPASLVDAMCRWLDISSRHLTITRGADEAIDCLMRTFCVPRVDNVVICPPTFAMYAQSAMLQGVETRCAPLDQNFDIDLKLIDQESDKNTKIIFVCSPNNPTANLMSRDKIIALCTAYADQAVVVVDETYVEFSVAHSFVGALDQFANLVVLRTLSKSHAAAGLRCGAAIARADITALLQKVLAPYPIPQPVAALATQILQPDNLAKLAEKRADIVARRAAYAERFTKLSSVRAVLPSDTNYFLLLTHDAAAFCQRAAAANIILRDQSHQPGLANSVRVTIGSPDQMEQLFAALHGRQMAPDKPQRVAQVTRKTNETAISVTVNLDRVAPVRINTGIGFYDHMLDQIAKHGGFSLELDCAGDLEIDPHHSVEDCAIALGQAIRIALGDKMGIGRYGFCLPMDESLVQVALDFGGRFYLDFKADFPESHVGDLPTDMVPHVFYSLAENLQANLHIAVTGDNTHHMVEACFKGFGRALRQAVKIDGTEMPSTKGTL